MIVSRLVGGLGNQMFQYAFGCALAARHRTSFALDLRLYREYRRHGGFELGDAFEVPEGQASGRQLWKLLGWRAPLGVLRRLESNRLRTLRGPRFYRQEGTVFDPAVRHLPGGCYVSGYWQSERFFEDYQGLVRQRFTFATDGEGGDDALARKIRSCTAVSVHIRRGDYLVDPATLAVHGLLPVEYYSAAFANISRVVDRPTFFLFSDDMDWVRAALPAPPQAVYVDRGQRSFDDLRLMSLCRHHIIANSSFSWWGAWLNPRPEKLVIAPRQWFASVQFDSRDQCPKDWVRL